MSGASVAGARPGPVSEFRSRRRVRRPLPRSHVRRAVYSLSAVAIVLAIGTLGFHAIADVGFVDAFYFEAMLATGQGPPFTLTSDSAKLFASLMAFVSVGSVLTSIVFTLGPIVSRIWHEAAERVEREARTLEEEFRERERRP